MTRGSLSGAQTTVVEWLLDPSSAPTLAAAPVAPQWHNPAMAEIAVAVSRGMAAGCRLVGVEARGDGEVRAALIDQRGREWALLLTFAAPAHDRLTRLCVRPVLDADVTVRPVTRADLAALMALELTAPVRRDDGTEVLIDHRGRQLDHEGIVRDHRWLGAFRGNRLLAVQAVAVVEAPIDGRMQRIAYNHYSRSDPTTRHAGNHLHLVSTLYRDVFPHIDQFLSVVDVHNPTGLRLSFGEPWPGRVRRLFLSTAALAARPLPTVPRRPFDAAHAAALLNATHAGLQLWVPRRPEFLIERARRAPKVCGPAGWQLTAHAALSVWPSGERRRYRRDDQVTERTLAPVLDFGFDGDRGREELTVLFAAAACELRDQGISHLAIFMPEQHPPTAWLETLAESVDTYAVCAPRLASQPPPAGPVYIDHVLF